METSEIEVVPKDSMKKSSSIFAPIFIVLGSFLVWDSSVNAPNIYMAVIGSVGIIVCLIWVPVVHNLKITFGENAIQKKGFWPRQIAYDNIQKIVVRKGNVEVHGDGFFNVISIGDLYTNFEEANHLLASVLKNSDEIELKGSDEYIEQYLEVSPAA